MVIKSIPLEIKQSSQIGIPEKLAIGLVALFVPTSDLAALIAATFASKFALLQRLFDWGLLCHNTRKERI